MLLDEKQIEDFYKKYKSIVNKAGGKFGPLTLTEKILYAHLENLDEIDRGKSSLSLNIDQISMQDATSQMALLQFMLTDKDKVEVPTSIHCDHLIKASIGAGKDLEDAIITNKEVYDFLKSASNKYNIDFWNPGSGIIHQVVLENYAFPGALNIGTDSHTPNGGGLSMIAIGVGGVEASEVMAGQPWSIVAPKIIGVHLKGSYEGWTAPKDIILKVAEMLTVKGGTGYILEYFGDGTKTISATGKATITNMGAEIGATTSIFPYDSHSSDYLRATRRKLIAGLADDLYEELGADPEIEIDPERFFDKVIEIDLSKLEPQITGPYSPDLGRSVSKIKEESIKKDWPLELKYVLLGSCTNSSYEDLKLAAEVAKEAASKGLKSKCGFMVTPGSEQVYRTIKRDGLIEDFESIGGVVLANACGPCIGQWNRTDVKQGEKNSILTTYNRNFRNRNDQNPGTHMFITSPAISIMYALAGRLDFNPLEDMLEAPDGSKVLLKSPSAEILPDDGFVFDDGMQSPSGKGEVVIDPNSKRIALLELFTEWKSGDFKDLYVLGKSAGKCTTDHISPAGPWLAFRGNLDAISDNLFSGVTNAYTGEIGMGKDNEPYNEIARHYKENDKGWVFIGGENYGEGSSREHAAMEPRYLGCRAIIAKSYARIAEVNLKKQGVMPLWFTNHEDYDEIREDDTLTIRKDNLDVGSSIDLMLKHSDGTAKTIPTTHTYTKDEINWFNAGSTMNYIKNNQPKSILQIICSKIKSLYKT